MGFKHRSADRALFSAEYVRSVLSYDSKTGNFLWKERLSRRKPIGSIATTICHNKNKPQKTRKYIKIHGCKFLAAHIAWLYVYGEWPELEVDHRDRDKLNDAIDNLREASTMKNMMNMTKTKRNTSGHKGVNAHGVGWVAGIRADGYRYHLGWFKELDHAAAVYRIAAAGMHAEYSGI